MEIQEDYYWDGPFPSSSNPKRSTRFHPTTRPTRASVSFLLQAVPKAQGQASGVLLKSDTIETTVSNQTGGLSLVGMGDQSHNKYHPKMVVVCGGAHLHINS